MKIISKFKDYYDHLVSYYGYDDHIVYDRRPTDKLPLLYCQDLTFIKGDSIVFSICGQYIPIYINSDGTVAFSRNEIKENKHDKYWAEHFFIKYENRKSTLNTELRNPIIASRHNDWHNIQHNAWHNIHYVPILKDFKFASRFDAHELYQNVYAFLGWLKDHPEPPNTQTNKDKILAHGFDARTSFRPNIKNAN